MVLSQQKHMTTFLTEVFYLSIINFLNSFLKDSNNNNKPDLEFFLIKLKL
jgi:hypothetical protein